MGFDKDRFSTENIPDICACLICQQVLEEPMRCPDSHSFCFACITGHISEHKQCPVNRRMISNLDLLPLPLKTYESLAKLQLHCVYEANGCCEEVYLSDIIKHQSECRFKAAIEVSSSSSETAIKILKQRVTNLKSEIRLEKARCLTLVSEVDSLKQDLASQRNVNEADKKLIETLRSSIEELNNVIKSKDQLVSDKCQSATDQNARSSRSRGLVAEALRTNEQDANFKVIKTSSNTFAEIRTMLCRQSIPTLEENSSSDSSNGGVTIHDEPFDDSDTDVEPIEEDAQEDLDLPDAFVSIPFKEFRCLKCKFSSDDQESLEDHVTKFHPQPKLQKCFFPGCNLQFRKQSEHDQHMIFHSARPNPYSCQFDSCEERFPKFVDLTAHVNKDHAAVFYYCGHCDFRATVWRQLKAHQAVQHSTGEGRPFKCQYEGCGKSYFAQKCLEVHDYSHTGEKPFSCDCGDAFMRKDSLVGHRKKCLLLRPELLAKEPKRRKVRKSAKEASSSSNSADERDSVPDEPFDDVDTEAEESLEEFEESDLEAPDQFASIALKKAKKSAKPFACDFSDCFRRFTSQSALDRHKIFHSGQKPYACEFDNCEERFSRFEQLADHVDESHRADGCPCNQCDLVARRWKKLKVHQAVEHTNDKKPFKCWYDGCEKRYTSLAGLEYHDYSHTRDKPHGCECGKSFAQFEELTTHRATCRGVMIRKPKRNLAKNSVKKRSIKR